MQRSEFITHEANRHLKRLGFTIEEFRRPSAPPAQVQSADSTENHRERETENSVTFAVSLEPDEDGFIVASCPQLPGCHSQGRSRQEAVKNIEEAIRGYIASMKSHEEEIPRVDWDLVRVSV
jgi:predicted RNase H-like HicB family nuclease